MKKAFLFSLLCLTSLYSTQLSENLYSSNYDSHLIEKKNSGHFTFKLGLLAEEGALTNVYPVFAFGYLSKKRNTPYFQSILIELEKGYKHTDLSSLGLKHWKKEYLYFYPKVVLISYIMNSQVARPFFGVGGALGKFLCKIGTEDTKKIVTTEIEKTIHGCLQFGIETGKQTAAIGIWKIEWNKTLYIYHLEAAPLRVNSISLSYTAGF